MNKAVFLDRDGVINKFLPQGDPNKPETWNYILSWKDFEFEDGVFEAFRLLENTDYICHVVSNQSCIGRGLVSRETIGQIFTNMQDVINLETGVFVGYGYCPHKPDENCACRKPKPGLIWQMAVEYEIDLSKSWMIGDSPSDLIAADRAGIPIGHRIQIGKRNGMYVKVTGRVKDSLLEAVKYMLEVEKYILGVEK